MQAGFREMHDARIARLADHLATVGYDLETVDAVEEGARHVRPVGVLIGQRAAVAASIPLLAGDDAGVAADAHVEIDDETELFDSVGRAGRLVNAPTPARSEVHSPAHQPARWLAQRRKIRLADFAGIRLLDADAQVVPGSLPGDRIGIRPAHSVVLRRQKFVDQMVDQKSLLASGACPCSAQARFRLPMAFHVHIVSSHWRRRCARSRP
jgi:hypothetical protein